MRRILPLAALLAVASAGSARAAAADATLLPEPAIQPLVIPPAPAFFSAGPGSFRPDDWAGGAQLLSSNLEITKANPAPADPPKPDPLVIPILVAILTGAALRYRTSPAYHRLYASIYGPLSQY